MKPRFLQTATALLFVLVIGVQPSRGQKTNEETLKFRILRKDSHLVSVYASVIDPYGRPVMGLERNNFSVWEADGRTKFAATKWVQQEIMNVVNEDSPLSVCFVFDTSQSMTNKLDKAKRAFASFMRKANPSDDFCMVAYINGKAYLVSDFVKSKELEQKMMSIATNGMTPLYDAIYMAGGKLGEKQSNDKEAIKKLRALEEKTENPAGKKQLEDEIRERTQRYVMLVISDGGDNHSRYAAGDVRRIVKESDVQIYAIGIFDPESPTEEERLGPQLLRDITDMTGGRVHAIKNANDLEDIAVRIGDELRSQYIIYYKPPSHGKDKKESKKEAKGKDTDLLYQKIEVRVKPPKGMRPLSIFARRGYYAPVERSKD